MHERVRMAAPVNSPLGKRSGPKMVAGVIRSPGTALDDGTRKLMETRFGADFREVRVHVDEAAGASARAVHALAYTVGDHIAFAPGRYRPGTEAGRLLLAHELTHVLQQRNGDGVASGLRIIPPGDASEMEAQRVADGRDRGVHYAQPAGVLQRAGGDPDPREKSRQSKPRNAPPGTKPIDQTGKSKDEIHEIKDGVGAGPKDWVGISPDGHVITSDPDGNAEDHGPAGDYTHRTSIAEEMARKKIPRWVWALLGAAAAAAIIACFATGVCEFAALAALAGATAAAVILGILRASGIRDSGAQARGGDNTPKDDTGRKAA